MADGADHRQRRGGNRPRYALVIEAVQLLEGTAAPRQHDDVRLRNTRGKPQAFHDAGRSRHPLHGGGHQHDAAARPAARGDGDEVVHHRAGGRGAERDTPRYHRKRALARLIEEPFRFQLLLQLLEGKVEVAHAVISEGVDVELVLPGALVDSDAALGQHALAFLGPKPQRLHALAPHHAAQLAHLVLQREVQVPRRIQLAVADLPAHHHPLQRALALQQRFHVAGDLADGKNVRFRRHGLIVGQGWGRCQGEMLLTDKSPVLGYGETVSSRRKEPPPSAIINCSTHHDVAIRFFFPDNFNFQLITFPTRCI
ncbi:MAG: hypothetical protein BWY76_02466 [bacterium ADurb.Bin429]|nr:MAG: hypothetical protein BWY76_02466 [bacterium ADurb.Bin429]